MRSVAFNAAKRVSLHGITASSHRAVAKPCVAHFCKSMITHCQQSNTIMTAVAQQERQFASGPSDDFNKAVAKIIDSGYSEEVALGICNLLSKPDSGIPAGMLCTMVTSMAGRPEVGEDAGLEALAKSVEQELARNAGKKEVTFSIQPPNGDAFSCKALEGMSLKEIAEHGDGAGAQMLAEYLECACSGVMACSTCHVYVDKDWFSAVGEPSDEELDMIELAHEPRPTSRLGCQIAVTPKLEGMKLELPGGANNLFDHIPFE